MDYSLHNRKERRKATNSEQEGRRSRRSSAQNLQDVPLVVSPQPASANSSFSPTLGLSNIRLAILQARNSNLPLDKVTIKKNWIHHHILYAKFDIVLFLHKAYEQIAARMLMKETVRTETLWFPISIAFNLVF